MGQKRWSLSVPLEGFSLVEHVQIAREAEQAGYTDAWSMEVDGVDCFAPLATLAQATDLRLGTAIANVYTRGPATLAMSAAGPGRTRPEPVLSGHRRGFTSDCRILERRQVCPPGSPGTRNAGLPAPGVYRRACHL